MGQKKDEAYVNEFPPKGDEFYSLGSSSRGLSRRIDEYKSTAWQTDRPHLGLAVYVLATFLAMGVFSVAQANEHSATRSFSATTVALGAK